MNKYIIILSFLLFSISIFSQKNQIENIPNLCKATELQSLYSNRMSCVDETTCHDPNIRDGYLYDTSQPFKIVKTKIRIIRETNGTNPAVSLDRVAMQMHHLNLNYAPYGIQFTYIIEYVDDSNFRTLPNNTTIQQILNLMATNVSEEDQYCNIFVGTGPYSLGIQPWLNNIGSLGIYIAENLQFYPNNNRNSLTHEMGHSLGLYHTFYGYAEVSCGYECAENMLNYGDSKGDFCADTPPQDLSFNAGFTQTTDNCNNIPFDPIAHINYMSYSDNKLEFTPQQVARMHCYFGTYQNRSDWLDNTNPVIPYIFEDDFGYSFTTEENVDASDWIDIASTDNQIQGMQDDNVVGPFDLGFDATLYNDTFNQIYIGSNGYISNSNININSVSSLFPNIPTQDANNGFFAPYLSDLNFTGAGNISKVYFLSNQSDEFIVTFENVAFYTPSTGYIGSNTFQMIYNKTLNTIKYQYLSMDEYYPINTNQTTNPSIIGIESSSGIEGLEVNNYRIPKNNSRVTFTFNQLGINDNNLNQKIVHSIYPNPVNDVFFIEADFIRDYSNLSIKIFNIQGKLLKEITKINTIEQHIRIPMNISGFTFGSYFYTLNKGNKQLFNGKILKK